MAAMFFKNVIQSILFCNILLVLILLVLLGVVFGYLSFKACHVQQRIVRFSTETWGLFFVSFYF